MAAPVPMICTTRESLNHLKQNINDWLDDGVKVHFLLNTHISARCDPNFDVLRNGLHPSIKLIFISPHLENEANELIENYDENHPNQDEEATAPGDRTCPACGEE